MNWVRRARARRLVGPIREREALWATHGAERQRIQLERLNTCWQRTIEDVPHYRALHTAGAVPRRFDSIEEFVRRVPATEREDLQHHATAMTSGAAPADFKRVTGGSTAKPIQLPAWNSEVTYATPDLWLGRAWYGIEPDARLFLIWGHSHLMGTGLSGLLNTTKRKISDRLLGYHRFSAYDLQPKMMRRAGDALLRFSPDYLVGYSVALDLFAAANEDRGGEFAGLDLRAVIGTAEGFPGDAAVERLRTLLGARVAMEYGSVETGVIAHTHPDGGYRAFWHSFLLEVDGDGSAGYGPRPLRVTTLYPRCFPLVRYAIGDEVQLEPDADSCVGLDRFHRVVGRCNDYVLLSDGARIHSEVFSHAVRECPDIRGFQVVQGEVPIRLHYTAARSLRPADEQVVRERLGKVHPELAGAVFEQVARLEQTVAGKTRMVVGRK